jgi:hypothetical protein
MTEVIIIMKMEKVNSAPMKINRETEKQCKQTNQKKKQKSIRIVKNDANEE